MMFFKWILFDVSLEFNFKYFPFFCCKVLRGSTYKFLIRFLTRTIFWVVVGHIAEDITISFCIGLITNP